MRTVNNLIAVAVYAWGALVVAVVGFGLAFLLLRLVVRASGG
jgi:hypothetical protein